MTGSPCVCFKMLIWHSLGVMYFGAVNFLTLSLSNYSEDFIIIRKDLIKNGVLLTLIFPVIVITDVVCCLAFYLGVDSIFKK